MHFGNPQLLWLLLLWPVLAWLGWAGLAWRERAARSIGRPQLLDRLYPHSVRRWRRVRFTLLLLALGLLILAAARPQYGRIEQTIRSVGSNVLIAVDCSTSMLARDIEPNRMERAKEGLDLLLRRLQGNRIGIIAFAGTAVLQCPMTLDQSMAQLVLKSLDTDSVSVQGTNIGAAIRTAMESFENGATEGGRALVLLTDGEDNEGQGLAAAREAAGKDIRIYAIGFGTARGMPLMSETGGGFKKDPSGRTVTSRLQLEALDAIAKAANGTAYDAGASLAETIESVAAAIREQEKTDLETRRQILYQDRFQWFLAPALILLFWLMLSRPEATLLERPIPTRPVELQKV